MEKDGMTKCRAMFSFPTRADSACLAQGQLFITQEGPGVAISKIPFSILTEVSRSSRIAHPTRALVTIPAHRLPRCAWDGYPYQRRRCCKWSWRATNFKTTTYNPQLATQEPGGKPDSLIIDQMGRQRMEAHRPAITAAKRKMAEEEEKRWKTPRRQAQNPQEF